MRNVKFDRSDSLQLAELGRLVVDSKREREGRAKAFLSVPLFAAAHDKGVESAHSVYGR
jgi:hypothetical protein